MKIAIGSDHAGFELKEKVKVILKALGNEIIDYGTDSTDSVDYSDFGLQVAKAVASGEVDRGVTVCWTGNGMNIVANKVDGIRATIAINPDMAMLARAHNNSNVLTLASKYTDNSQLEEILKAWLETGYDGGRHTRRLAKIPGAGMA